MTTFNKPTANDLSDALVREHRVMFSLGRKDGTMVVVTDAVREGLDSILSAALAGRNIVVQHIDDAGEDVKAAYPMIMTQTAVTHAGIVDATEPNAVRRRAARPRASFPRKLRAPKPE